MSVSNVKTAQAHTPTPSVVLAVSLLLGGLVVGWTSLHATTAVAAEPAPAKVKAALTVAVQPPQPVRWAQTLSANGNVAPWQEVSVSAETSGLRLADVRAQVGDVVKAGQVLAVFDTQTVRLELQAAQASLAEAKAQAADAKAQAARAQQLLNSGALSEQQIAQLQAAAQSTEARVAAAQAQVDLASLRLRQAEVKAPDAGVVTARSATLGAVVPAGTELFRLIRQGRLEWRAEVPAADLALVQAGQTVVVRTPGGVQAPAKVRMVAPAVDASSRLATVYVDLKTPVPPALKAGMYASGDITLGERDGLSVPMAAVVNRDGFSYVFVLKPAEGASGAPQAAPSGTAQVMRVKVQLGRRQGDRVEVASGLPSVHAAVVVQGAGFLNDGDTVTVVNPATVQKTK